MTGERSHEQNEPFEAFNFFKCKILFSSLLSLLFKYKMVESFWKVGLPQCLSPGLTTWIQSQEKINSPDQTNQGTQTQEPEEVFGSILR